ncbi:hypothetical protein JZ751_018770 [Albula glossodonta]|uniref:DNA helicase n=1 Tax=Albula glossodonta TaxID=121402 RepID=A0A8T2NQ08_9TELE|nr:hypothetical protein JZ751_018770 [Albula glossodonta]
MDWKQGRLREIVMEKESEWKENPNLTEAQVQSMALGRQASVELELKRREAMYRDVLSKQQTLMMYVQKVITNRKVQEQQIAMANRANLLNQLALQNGMMGAQGLSQIDLLGLYQQFGGQLSQALPGMGAPNPQMGKNPGLFRQTPPLYLDLGSGLAER